MTKRQFERWKDFALRAAVSAVGANTENRKARLRDALLDWFEDLEQQGFYRGMVDWDHSEGGAPIAGDYLFEFFDEYNHIGYSRKTGFLVREDEGRFFSQLSCCIRAGMDLASAPSAGVLGFTVGDFRRMYDGKIPLWLCRKYKGGLSKVEDKVKIMA